MIDGWGELMMESGGRALHPVHMSAHAVVQWEEVATHRPCSCTFMTLWIRMSLIYEGTTCLWTQPFHLRFHSCLLHLSGKEESLLTFYQMENQWLDYGLVTCQLFRFDKLKAFPAFSSLNHKCTLIHLHLICSILYNIFNVCNNSKTTCNNSALSFLQLRNMDLDFGCYFLFYFEVSLLVSHFQSLP